jgi:flagella basal body P-ring formation protein FlgA
LRPATRTLRAFGAARAGTLLLDARAEVETLAVARGEWASLRSISGAVVLESRVEVLQDGRPGERVRVRQQGATGIVFARAVERGVLELTP